MTKRTRYFVMGAGAILVAGLTTGLVASMVGLPAVLSRAAGPDELQFVPPDAVLVGYANVREVMSSEFHQRFRRMAPQSPERNEFQEKTGLDIEQDIASVVVAMLPEPGAAPSGADRDRDDSKALVLARGRFNAPRLERLALDHGGTVEDYRGKRLLTRIDNHDFMTMGFLDADLVAMGSDDAVRRAIDAQASGRSVTSNTDLMRQVSEVDGNSAWAVGRFDAIAGHTRLPAEIRAQVPAVTWFSAAGRVDGGLTGQLKAEARDDEAAQNLRDILRGFMALAKLQSGSRPGMKQMVDSLQLAGDGRMVTLQFAVPRELFDALEEMHRQHNPDAAPRPPADRQR